LAANGRGTRVTRLSVHLEHDEDRTERKKVGEQRCSEFIFVAKKKGHDLGLEEPEWEIKRETNVKFVTADRHRLVRGSGPAIK